MHILRIVRIQCGWAIQSGSAMISPCRSRLAALGQAEQMADALRSHGEAVQIIAECDDADEASDFPKLKAVAERLRAKRACRATEG